MISPIPDPFAVLRLEPTAPGEEVVRQADLLLQSAATEADSAAIRQAVQALTSSPEERALHELLTHPSPCYRWAAVEAFGAAFALPPAAPAVPPAPPEMDVEELAGLFRSVAAAEWDVPAPPFGSLDAAEPPEEIARQVVEAYWQSLVHESRA